MYFPSKKDAWLTLIILLSILVCFIPLFSKGNGSPITTLPIAAFLLWLWFSTGYKIEGDLLIVRSGPFKRNIPIKEIEKIRRSNSLLASYALSIKRLEITFSKYGLVYVSPKDEQDFINLLKEVNPTIQTDSVKT
ncbi:PH domain-containing protein [Bacillus sp. FJAT-27445]|uniref:PH domain-containing protein n=1 Tax=Bacillus sp. FJAT-27445 TaxID=1679166 RepID=UPI00074355C7|nr:PH domain-containing protein [Bacillus sp. FJAT-27445]